MRRSFLFLTLAAALLWGCAKAPQSTSNDAAKHAFDAWIQVNHPTAVATELGSYILEDVPGTGALAGDASTSPYVRVDYVVRTLDGTVQSTTDADLAHHVGIYTTPSAYYPYIWSRANNGLPVGMDEMISTMRVGGRRVAVVPGWLAGTDRYKTVQEYLDKVNGNAYIYDFTLLEVFSDIKKWETDSVGRYISAHFPGKSVQDSLKYGFYYFRTAEPTTEESFAPNEKFYINYVGRLLDGTVFDTNVRDSARFYDIYDAYRTYTPATVTWYSSGSDYTTIKMNDGSVKDGFAYALSKMHPHEKGTAVFYSGLGYSSTGAGSYIPAFSPLRFDIEIVDQP